MTTTTQFVIKCATRSYPYTQPEYDAFGWSPLSRAAIDPAESYGLDYESARDATPSWYGVSFGNGNDGVSHMWPDYYCRTADPFKLAAAAVIARFNHKYKERAADVVEIDGEANYTISATIYNPEDIEESDDEESDDEESDDEESDDGMSYCDANGAWVICEVFRVEDMPGALLPNGEFAQYNPFDKPAYTNLKSCFSEEDLRLADTA